MDVLTGNGVDDPEELMINNEEFLYMEEKMGEVLSDFEREVLTLYLDGQSYLEISEKLGRHVKSIDNALQRVKRKLERHLQTNESGTS
jgi:RNA polymerase sporulation-specific sigma factor